MSINTNVSDTNGTSKAQIPKHKKKMKIFQIWTFLVLPTEARNMRRRNMLKNWGRHHNSMQVKSSPVTFTDQLMNSAKLRWAMLDHYCKPNMCNRDAKRRYATAKEQRSIELINQMCC